MEIKGAIFDMDGTLIDSLGFWESYWRSFGIRFFGKEDFVVDPSVDRRVRTTIFVQAIRLAKEFYHLDVSDEELEQFSRAGIDEFYRNDVAVKPGVFAFLEHLRERGIKRYVASASEMGHIRLALSCHGLDAYFDSILSCADIGKNKSDPDIYLLAQEQMGFTPGEICVFEDSYVALETAKSVGFQTVGIFDACNFSQERLCAASDIYLSEGETWDMLIPRIS